MHIEEYWILWKAKYKYLERRPITAANPQKEEDMTWYETWPEPLDPNLIRKRLGHIPEMRMSA